VAVIGLAYALYGILSFYLIPGTLLWFQKYAYLESVTSTFINRNSYATYAGLGLMSALAGALSEYSRTGAKSERSRLRRSAYFLGSTAGAGGAWVAVAFVIGMALVLTGSRAGILASLTGVAALALLVLMRGRSMMACLALFLHL
jgi:hypothetical protein